MNNSQARVHHRLRAVLELLAAHAWSKTIVPPTTLLAMVITELPLDERESELLSGGVPRGYKQLVTATTHLVKAGWLIKHRRGWIITHEGLRALVAFPTTADFSDAISSAKSVPPNTPLPSAPPVAPDKTSSTSTAHEADTHHHIRPESPAEEAPLNTEGVRALGSNLDTRSNSDGDDDDRDTVRSLVTDPGLPTGQQPDAVSIAGDFEPFLRPTEIWVPHLDKVQMTFDPTDRLWKLRVHLPTALYHYKVAINRSWEENYGMFGVPHGADIELDLLAEGDLIFQFDYATKHVETVYVGSNL